MSGELIQGWSMGGFIMASSGEDAVERKMKVTSWEVVVVVVIAIGTESGVMGSMTPLV